MKTSYTVKREIVQIESNESKLLLPLSQVLRIMLRHATGESNRKIAAVEKVNHETVAIIVRSEAMREFLRQSYYALIENAIKTIAVAIDNGNTEMAYKVLQDTGVIQAVIDQAELVRQAQTETRTR